MQNIAIVIPARYASTRLPGKPLIKVQDKTIIRWVYEKASASKLAGSVIVATDDEKIHDEVKSFGGKVEMTSPNHQSGSDRIAEVVKKLGNIDIAVNVQGDEPLIKSESIDKAIEALLSDKEAAISTLIRKITNKDEIMNPNIVKVVKNNNNNALYFSRSAIPYPRVQEEAEYYGHIGLYAYRKEALLEITKLEQTNLEKTESLEQLRALQNGYTIKTVEVDYKPIGIDVPDDVEHFKNILAKTPL